MQQIDRKFILMLIQSHGFLEYMEAILLDERSSLNNSVIINFLNNFLPKVGISQKELIRSNFRPEIRKGCRSIIFKVFLCSKMHNFILHTQKTM